MIRSSSKFASRSACNVLFAHNCVPRQKRGISIDVRKLQHVWAQSAAVESPLQTSETDIANVVASKGLVTIDLQSEQREPLRVFDPTLFGRALWSKVPSPCSCTSRIGATHIYLVGQNELQHHYPSKLGRATRTKGHRRLKRILSKKKSKRNDDKGGTSTTVSK